MAKYIKNDNDFKVLKTYDIADFNKYMMNYDVDANVETSKGKDAFKIMWNIMRGRKLDLSFKFKNINDIYVFVYTILISFNALAFINILVLFIYYLVTWLITKNPIRMLIVVILLQIVGFIIGIVIICTIMSRLRDDVQSRIEKIVYKL